MSSTTVPTNWVDSIGMVENAAFLNNLGAQVNSKVEGGTLSSRPAAGNLNAVYYCTDNDTIYLDNGTSWVKTRIGADSCDAMGDVPTSGWTAVNMQTGSSYAADKDAMLFTAAAAQTTLGFQYRAYPTPPFTLTAYLDSSYNNGLGNPVTGGEFLFTGLAISDGTKYITLGHSAAFTSSGSPWLAGAGWYAGATEWNTTTASALGYYNTYFTPAAYLGQLPKWFRFSDNGTNRTMQFSINGIDWKTVFSETRTTFLTPTRIGVAAQVSAASSALLRVRSWNGVS